MSVQQHFHWTISTLSQCQFKNASLDNIYAVTVSVQPHFTVSVMQHFTRKCLHCQSDNASWEIVYKVRQHFTGQCLHCQSDTSWDNVSTKSDNTSWDNVYSLHCQKTLHRTMSTLSFRQHFTGQCVHFHWKCIPGFLLPFLSDIPQVNMPLCLEQWLLLIRIERNLWSVLECSLDLDHTHKWKSPDKVKNKTKQTNNTKPNMWVKCNSCFIIRNVPWTTQKIKVT